MFKDVSIYYIHELVPLVTKPKEPVRWLRNDVNFHIATMTMQYITGRTSVYLMEKTCKKHQVFVSRLNLVH